MGLEFKPLLPWEGEDHDRYPSEHFCAKKRRGAQAEASSVQQQHQQNISTSSTSSSRGGAVAGGSRDRDLSSLISETVVNSSSAHREYHHHHHHSGVLLNTLARVISRELVEALAVGNNQNLEYPVLVASEEDNVNEYKSFFSIVLDYPQILGQGETKEYSLRQATRLMHVAFGSMLLKGESIPPPTSGSALEVMIMPCSFCCSDHHGIRIWSPLSFIFPAIAVGGLHFGAFWFPLLKLGFCDRCTIFFWCLICGPTNKP
jgi:hypothetical protein